MAVQGARAVIRFRPLPWLTLASVAAFALLVQLGSWQWRRFEDKRDPQPRPQITIEAKEPLPDAAQYVYAVLDGAPGWRALAPVRDDSGRVIFVDVGFTPGLEPPTRPPADIKAGQTLSGEPTRAALASPFLPEPEPELRRWYRIDPKAMGEAAGLAGVEPFWLAARGFYGDRPHPFAAGADPLPPERHLGYALTWWGLAAGLLAVYVALHVREGRLRLERGR